MKRTQSSDQHLRTSMESPFIHGWGSIIHRCGLSTNGVQHTTLWVMTDLSVSTCKIKPGLMPPIYPFPHCLAVTLGGFPLLGLNFGLRPKHLLAGLILSPLPPSSLSFPPSLPPNSINFRYFNKGLIALSFASSSATPFLSFRPCQLIPSVHRLLMSFRLYFLLSFTC